ncbi:acyltransferase [Bacteroides thetaiotaomicron]|jgi:acetyltransferase-like isoleucine patch superfamily enzyme
MQHRSSKISIVGTPNIKDFANIEVGNNSELRIGSGFSMRQNVTLAVRDNSIFSIGSGVFINRNTIIMARKSITIADGVTIGPNVCIYDHDHDIYNRGGYFTAKVIIGKNVWIGANVVILKGITIGENSVISAGCIVTKDVPINTILIQKRTNTLIEK